ncbi:hypothetical protein LTR86_009146 [Recurvomyces mirabilis]|nr:hypothetical protein LTR86_009146 [Recurvomyces mirabilis]
MEAQMRKKYATAVRKAKKGSVADSPNTEKRKNQDEPADSFQKTNISIEVGDITVNSEQDSLKLGSVTKKTKASASDAPTKSAAAKDLEPSPAKKKGETTMSKNTLSKTTPSKSIPKAKAELQAEDAPSKSRSTCTKKQPGVKKGPKKERAVKNQ